jgi:hypothetical protein
LRTDWHLKCENRTKNRHQVLTGPETNMRTGEYIYIYTYGEPSRFSHKTQIRFAEFSVSFIGSSCSPANLLLLLLLFSHGVALLVWRSNWIINYLIIIIYFN